MKNETKQESATRDMLVDLISSKPGLSFGDLMNILHLNEGTLRYHLRHLERSDLVSSKKVGRRRIYHACLLSNRSASVEGRLTRDQRRVVNMIKRNPGIESREILKKMDLSRKGLSNILKKLKKDCLVLEVENGNGIGFEYVTRERMKEELLLDLVEKLLTGEIDQSTFMRITECIEEER